MQKNILNIVFSAIIALSFFGCSNSIPGMAKKQKPLPSWYVNPKANTPLYLYGEGMGDSLNAAKTNALNNMASRLVVQVSSSLKSTTKSSTNGINSNYSKSLSKQVNIDVRKIEFSNAKVEKSTMQDEKFFVVMQVNRKELFKNNKSSFDGLDKRIDTLYGLSKSLVPFEQVGALEEIVPQIDKAISKGIVLNAINNSFDHQKFINKYNSYKDLITKLKLSMTIDVSSNENKNYFKDEIINLLNEKSYKIAKSSNSDVTIKLDNKINYSIASGWQIAKTTTTINVQSNGKTISNKIIKVNGRSSSSKANALADAAKNFGKKISSMGLDTIIYSK